MNQYLEEEKKKITEQIAETKKAAEASLWQKAAERADNNLSKAEQAEKNRKLNEFFNDTFEKYNALLRMQELLNNDFKGVTKPLEYVELSARVGNELTEEDYYKLNPTYKHDKDLNDEKQKVEGLIGKIAKATAENPKATMAQAKDQKMVLESEKDNYDALLRMQEILNNDFANEEEVKEYEELAQKVGLYIKDRKIYNSEIMLAEEMKIVGKKLRELKSKNDTNSEEYKNLATLYNFLGVNFSNMKNPYEYMAYRKNTSLGEMDENLYLMLITPKFPNIKSEELQKSKEEFEKQIAQRDQRSEDLRKSAQERQGATAEPTQQQTTQPEAPQQQTTPAPTPTPTPKNKTNFGQKIKVTGKRTLTWLNKHKKQILIALAIAAILAAIIAAFAYLMPAISSAMNLAEVSTLSSSMVNNAALWHGADAATQAALHATNATLAQSLQGLAGAQAVFEAGTGAWTIGGTELTAFAANAAASAEAALASAATATNTVLGIGGAGLGLGIIGSLLPKYKSAKYKEFNTQIKDLENNGNLTIEQLQALMKEIQDSNELSDKEKARLLNHNLRNKLLEEQEKQKTAKAQTQTQVETEALEEETTQEKGVSR